MQNQISYRDLWNKFCQKCRYTRNLEDSLRLQLEEITDLRNRVRKKKREPPCKWCGIGFCCSHNVFPDGVFPTGVMPYPQSKEYAVASADHVLQYLTGSEPISSISQAPPGLSKPMASQVPKKRKSTKNDREATSHFAMDSENEERDQTKRSSITEHYGDWTDLDNLDHVAYEDAKAEREGKEFLRSKQDEWEHAHWEAKAAEQASKPSLVDPPKPIPESRLAKLIRQNQEEAPYVLSDKEIAKYRRICTRKEPTDITPVDPYNTGAILSQWRVRASRRLEVIQNNRDSAPATYAKNVAIMKLSREIGAEEALSRGCLSPNLLSDLPERIEDPFFDGLYLDPEPPAEPCTSWTFSLSPGELSWIAGIERRTAFSNAMLLANPENDE